jgi:hypothetical protein
VTQATAFRLNVPFIKELGVEFLGAADGRSEVALNLEPWHLNSWSVAHGGVLMSLLDVAMAVAGRSLNARGGRRRYGRDEDQLSAAGKGRFAAARLWVCLPSFHDHGFLRG